MTTNVSPAVLQPGATLTASAAPYVTGAVNTLTVVSRAVFNNTGTAAVAFTVNRVPNGGSVATGNQIISGRTIAAGATDLAPELGNMVLAAGDSIECLAGTAAVVNFFAFGFVST